MTAIKTLKQHKRVIKKADDKTFNLKSLQLKHINI